MPTEGGVMGATESADLAVGQTVGSYVVKSSLGTGGCSSVYLGEHPLIGARVAIKVLSPESAAVPGMLEHFITEARASSKIDSPHIPKYFDFGRLPNGQPYAVMEYLEGETVSERLDRAGPFAVDSVALILRQVASALLKAHAVHIVHRDIKPGNLFLMGDGKGGEIAKVLDFGIAKLVSPGAASKTAFGVFLGTPSYCAPEQAIGIEIGPAADVYCLGATVFEMLTGRPPFEGAFSDILCAKIAKDPPSVREVRPELPEVVADTLAWMLARDPARRMQTMADVLAAVRRWGSGADAGDHENAGRPEQLAGTKAGAGRTVVGSPSSGSLVEGGRGGTIAGIGIEDKDCASTDLDAAELESIGHGSQRRQWFRRGAVAVVVFVGSAGLVLGFGETNKTSSSSTMSQQAAAATDAAPIDAAVIDAVSPGLSSPAQPQAVPAPPRSVSASPSSGRAQQIGNEASRPSVRVRQRGTPASAQTPAQTHTPPTTTPPPPPRQPKKNPSGEAIIADPFGD
ncbi:MAG: serine/threonine-protein kinase [Pseudomonadota bacterium]